MNDTYVFRIQDKKGRGPFKPGLSSRWVEERDDQENLVPWFMEFGMIHEMIMHGCFGGSACETLEQLKRWFTQSEYQKLLKLKYRCVRLPVGRILAKSDIQLFVESAVPFNKKAEVIELYN